MNSKIKLYKPQALLEENCKIIEVLECKEEQFPQATQKMWTHEIKDTTVKNPFLGSQKYLRKCLVDLSER